MHSTSNVTCSARTSATFRATVITGSGRRSGGQQATTATAQFIHPSGPAVTGHPARPEPRKRQPRTHDSSGWGEAPLDVRAEQDVLRGKLVPMIYGDWPGFIGPSL